MAVAKELWTAQVSTVAEAWAASTEMTWAIMLGTNTNNNTKEDAGDCHLKMIVEQRCA